MKKICLSVLTLALLSTTVFAEEHGTGLLIKPENVTLSSDDFGDAAAFSLYSASPRGNVPGWPPRIGNFVTKCVKKMNEVHFTCSAIDPNSGVTGGGLLVPPQKITISGEDADSLVKINRFYLNKADGSYSSGLNTAACSRALTHTIYDAEGASRQVYTCVVKSSIEVASNGDPCDTAQPGQHKDSCNELKDWVYKTIPSAPQFGSSNPDSENGPVAASAQ